MFLIAGIAVESASACTYSATDGSTFKCAAGLVADDAACGSTEKAPCGSTTLGIGSGLGAAACECKHGDDGWKKQFQFHSNGFNGLVE